MSFLHWPINVIYTESCNHVIFCGSLRKSVTLIGILQYSIFKPYSPHGYWNFWGFFSMSLKYMVITKFDWAMDVQIQLAHMTVLENIVTVIHWPHCVKGWIFNSRQITIYLINGNGLSYWLPLISPVANHLSYLLPHINQQDLVFWTNLGHQYLITNLRQWAKCGKCDNLLLKLRQSHKICAVNRYVQAVNILFMSIH